MSLREITIVFSIGLLITLTPSITSNSWAAKPHFLETPEIIKNSDMSITVNYNAKDLGKRTVNVTLSSDTSALVGCINPGGKLSPSKGTIDHETQTQSVKLKPEDGKIQGSLKLGPPTVPSGSELCPNKNWSSAILSLTYENVLMEIKQKNSQILKLNLGNVSE